VERALARDTHLPFQADEMMGYARIELQRTIRSIGAALTHPTIVSMKSPYYGLTG